MRNLKKILALVLALVMSLSLMATASAGTFEDVADDNAYKTATDVLNGLEVFRGYEDGTFRPEKTITRAEVATIIYRIATADVKDEQNQIYTTWNKFSDVKDTDWYAGYVNYCANAEYVMGHPNGTFTPQSEVTGYAVLAMILRTMGWDKNGEFEGDDWQVQTAATARQEGLLDGITNATDAQLGQPAPRGMVAQILFNALLTEMVDYSVLGGYQHNGKTLGGTMFGLESVTGVIMANQWANLKETKDGGNKILAVDKTAMKVTNVVTKAAGIAVGDDITLEIASDLDAVGLSYTAYVAGTGATRTPLTDLVDAGNTVAFNEGKGVNTNLSDQGFASIAKLAAKESLTVNADSEYFTDYSQDWDRNAAHDILIRYTVNVGWFNNGTYVSNNLPATWINYLEDLASKSNPTVTRTYGSGELIEYTRTIRPDALVTAMDLEIMQEIFYSADRYAENPDNEVWRYVDGEVYVGTSSLKDVSDEISWTTFCDTYLDMTKMQYLYDSANNGESLRIVDNNGDGKAEYVLKVRYTMDKVVGTYKDALLLNTQAFDSYSADKNTLVAPELNQNDVVVYSLIDGQLNVRKAESDTDTIKTKDWKVITVTTAGDQTYGQSGITNATKMDEVITQMNESTEYIMYKDLFNFVRAYELAQGTKYALVTEMYTNGSMNWNYLKTNNLIAEIKVGEDDVAEHTVANPNTTPLVSGYAWTTRANLYNNTGYNFLQPAIAHLGQLTDINKGQYMGSTNVNAATVTSDAYSDWNRTVLHMVNSAEAGKSLSTYANTGNFGVFNYGQVAGKNYSNSASKPVMNSSSFTNVAAYTMSGDNVILDTAAQLMTTKDGEQVYYAVTNVGGNYARTWQSKWVNAYLAANYTNPTQADRDTVNKLFLDMVNGTNNSGLHNSLLVEFYPVFKTDYIQLNKQDVKANTVHYSINTSYASNYNTASNTYVDATVDTEFYIVMPNSIMYKVGFAELPTIKSSEIRAAYAVASNTAADSNDYDYWVADVIVIEVNKLAYDYDSISLMYYNFAETTGRTRYVDSLNNQWRAYQADSALKAKMEIVPASVVNNLATVTWGNTPWAIGTDYTDTDYGFYKLYNTENPAEGQLTAVEIEKITSNYNAWGIYAGEVYRVEGIVGSGYIDVNMSATATPKYDKIWVGQYAADVPIYRIETNYLNRVTGATELVVNPVRDYSEIQEKDQLIWVYDKANSKIAYIVDLGWRWPSTVTTANQTLANIAKASYTAPAWLYDYDSTSLTDSLYEDILRSQGTNPTGTPVSLTIECYDNGTPASYLGKITIPLIMGANMEVLEAQIESKLSDIAKGYNLVSLYSAFNPATGTGTAKSPDSGSIGVPGTAVWDYKPVSAANTAAPLYATFQAATYQVKAITNTTGGAAYTANTLTKNGANVSEASLPGSTTYKYGDTFSLDITYTKTTHEDFVTTVTSGAKDVKVVATSTGVTVSGTVTGDVVITVTSKTIDMVTVTLTETGDTGTITTSPVGSHAVKSEVSFTVAPSDTDHKVYGVEFKCAGVGTVLTKATADNKYTIPASMMANAGSVAITVLYYDTTANLTIDGSLDVTTAGDVEWNGTAFTTTGSSAMTTDLTTIKPGADTKIRIASLVPVTVSTVSTVAGFEAPTVKKVSDLVYEITNIYGNFTLNIAERTDVIALSNANAAPVYYSVNGGDPVLLAASTGSASIPVVVGQTIVLTTAATGPLTVSVSAGLSANGTSLDNNTPVTITVLTGGSISIAA